MPSVYSGDELEALAVFKEFGIRADEHLPAMSFTLTIQKRRSSYDASDLAERLIAKSLIKPDERGLGFFLTKKGADLLYAREAPQAQGEQ